jgi:hypothetical protein
VHVRLKHADLMAASFTDIPKTDFDVSTSFSLQFFRPEAAQGPKVPLFHMIGNTSTFHGGGRTPAEVVKSNPEADVLIATLELE